MTDLVVSLAVTGTLFVLVGWLALWSATPRLPSVYRVIAETPTPVDRLEPGDGPVTLRGVAVPLDGQTVESPFAQRPCLAYEYETRARQDAANSSGWETLDEGQNGVPFLLRDESGTIRIDPSAAAVSLQSQRLTSPSGGKLPPGPREYVKESDRIVDSRDESESPLARTLDPESRQMFTESRLEPGETVTVYCGLEDEAVPGASVDFVGADTEETNRTVVTTTGTIRTLWGVGRLWLVLFVAGFVVRTLGVVLLGLLLVRSL